jgi:hypothetical protein
MNALKRRLPVLLAALACVLPLSGRSDTNSESVLDEGRTDLDCSRKGLTSLDLSARPQLRSLFCANNRLTTMDLSACAKLYDLNCANNILTNLDLSANPMLSALNCDYNRLTNLNLSGNPRLYHLECRNNSLTNLDLSANPQLFFLDCSHNRLTKLDLSASTNGMGGIDCRNNPIVEIIVADTNTLPKHFYYSGKPVIRKSKR